MTNKEQHARAKTRITPQQHGDKQVWCDYTCEVQPCIVEAIYKIASTLEECGDDASPESVQAECLFYDLAPASLPWSDQYDLASHLLEGMADRFYNDAAGAEWTYTAEQRNALAAHLAPVLSHLASLVNVVVPDEDRAIDVSVDFVREVLEQEPKP